MPPRSLPYSSIFSILRPAVGPSSSHTLAPLLCARDFRSRMERMLRPGARASLRVELYGSLAATGKGHRTDCALVSGLSGERPEEGGSSLFAESLRRIHAERGVTLRGVLVRFDPDKDIRWLSRIPAWSRHPNTMRFVLRVDGRVHSYAYLSLGAGLFAPLGKKPAQPRPKNPIPYPYHTMGDLLAMTEGTGYPISHLVLANEAAFAGQSGPAVLARLEDLWQRMRAAIERGLAAEGELPGGLGVMRRAKEVWQESRRRVSHPEAILAPALKADAYAFAVAEENASGGAIVTAPTAGAAGVIPAVLKVWQEALALPDRTVARGLLTAGAVGIVIKNLASLSGAEVGCQGEVGSAAAMAAAAAAELAGAIPAQVEAAAEIAMEHHLGMTCDPVAGLVQIPCIERNAMGAVKALNAAAVSLAGTGRHLISFDAAVRAMWHTGQDLRTAYRETARGGLAVEGV